MGRPSNSVPSCGAREEIGLERKHRGRQEAGERSWQASVYITFTDSLYIRLIWEWHPDSPFKKDLNYYLMLKGLCLCPTSFMLTSASTYCRPFWMMLIRAAGGTRAPLMLDWLMWLSMPKVNAEWENPKEEKKRILVNNTPFDFNTVKNYKFQS